MASDRSTLSRTIPIFLRAVRTAGADAEVLARRFGLGEDAVDLPAVPTSLSVVCELPSAAAALLGEPGLGVRLATEIPPGLYGWPEQLVRFSSSLREALTRIVEFAPLLDDCSTFLMRADGAEGSVLQQYLDGPVAAELFGPQSNSLILCYLVRVTRELVQRSDWAPPSVRLAHADPVGLEALSDFLRSDRISFGGGRNCLTLERELLEQPLATRNAAIAATLMERAERLLAGAPRPFWSELRRHVAATLSGPGCSVHEVARAMAMSSRSLQRRLAEEQVTFSEAVDQVRFDLVTRWIAEGERSRAELARRLGYSNPRAFARAFERWTGQPLRSALAPRKR